MEHPNLMAIYDYYILDFQYLAVNIKSNTYLLKIYDTISKIRASTLRSLVDIFHWLDLAGIQSLFFVYSLHGLSLIYLSLQLAFQHLS